MYPSNSVCISWTCSLILFNASVAVGVDMTPLLTFYNFETLNGTITDDDDDDPYLDTVADTLSTPFLDSSTPDLLLFYLILVLSHIWPSSNYLELKLQILLLESPWFIQVVEQGYNSLEDITWVTVLYSIDAKTCLSLVLGGVPFGGFHHYNPPWSLGLVSPWTSGCSTLKNFQGLIWWH